MEGGGDGVVVGEDDAPDQGDRGQGRNHQTDCPKGRFRLGGGDGSGVAFDIAGPFNELAHQPQGDRQPHFL